MSLRITIDVFSGRPNPVVEVSGRQAKEVLERIKPEGALSKREVEFLTRPHLGYRGLIFEQIGVQSRSLPRTFRVVRGTMLGPDGARRTADEELEDFLFRRSGPLGKAKVAPGFQRFLAREVVRFHRAKFKSPHKVHKPPRCRCAPDYEPSWWNDGGQKQFGNNCYNYSTNYRTDTFSQPGLAAGAMYTTLTCASVRPAAIADDLIAKPGAKNRCPEDGHLVALVIAPGWDFHWYRKGEDGMWTHKPGGTPATNVDNSGHLIPDPRTADRGPYTSFCTFMVVEARPHQDQITSLENKQQWIAGAKIFSGRPDPIWTISQETAGKLLQVWDRLMPHRGPKLTPPGLGYRGCFLQERQLGRRWEAYEGVVSLGAEIRSDPHRSFESALLNTAPPNSGISASVVLNSR